MDMKRRDFLKMTAALAAAGVSPSLLAAGKEQFTVYRRAGNAQRNHCRSGVARQASEAGGRIAENLAFARPTARRRSERTILK